MSSYSTIRSHRSMVFDDLRNTLYVDAIRKIIKKDSVVLDLGAGLGLHGFVANSCGAKQVYLVEPASIIEVTDMLARANDLSEKVSCIPGKIEEIELPEKVDVIISVFTGNFLLTEDLLPSLLYARDKHLRPGGTLIPDRAKMEVVPVSAPEYHKKHISDWSIPLHGIDFSLVRKLAGNSLYYDTAESMDTTFLAKPTELLDLDFMTATEAACRNKIQVKITENGLCHGWLGWFQTRLGDKWLSTSPEKEQTHWSQVFLPLEQPINVQTGDVLFFTLNRPEFGEWTWTVDVKGVKIRHSTFLSEPVSMAKLQKKSDDYKPVLSQKGQVTLEVLERLNGSQSTAEIVMHMEKNYPTLFSSPLQASQFVKNLVERYS